MPIHRHKNRFEQLVPMLMLTVSHVSQSHIGGSSLPLEDAIWTNTKEQAAKKFKKASRASTLHEHAVCRTRGNMHR
jgi:hypothetical protein